MDDDRRVVPGARPVVDVLEHDVLYRLVGNGLAIPVVLGVVLFLIAVAIVILGPASESRFIYTDF